jgi:HAMP domain-containing protein
LTAPGAYVLVSFVTNPYIPYPPINRHGRAPTNLAGRVACILENVRGAIGYHAAAVRAAAPLLLITWNYLSHAARRLEALTRRVAAGTATIRPRARRAKDPTEPAKPRPTPKHPPLPRRFGWLVRLSPNVGGLGSSLRNLLTTDEIATLLADAPQAARILRPLCNMLGIARAPDLPAALFPERPKRPPKPRAPRPPKEPRAPRVRRKPRPIQIYPTKTWQEREALDRELAEWHANRRPYVPPKPSKIPGLTQPQIQETPAKPRPPPWRCNMMGR